MPRLVVSDSDPRQDFEPHLAFRPLIQTVTCGTLAVLLILGQFAVPALNAALGNPLGDGVPYVRLTMMFVGGGCAFAAWPVYKIMRDEEFEQRLAAQDKFHRGLAERLDKADD